MSQLIILRITAAISAARKPSISNPFTIVLTNQIIKALITKLKSPSVMMLIGNVKIVTIGLIIAFTNPRMNTVISAAYKPETVIPGIKYAMSIIAAAFISQRDMMCIGLILMVKITNEAKL